MGATFNFNFCFGTIFVILALTGRGETVVSSGGLLPGGSYGQSSTMTLDGMFGAAFDGAASGSINTLRGGEAGQLYETVGVLAHSQATYVPETSTCQLLAIATNDDGSYTDVAVIWAVLDGPLVAIDSNGLALAGTVYQDSPALAAAASGGFTGTVNLTVLDTLKDNYGLYAADGIADAWQVDNFGVNNTNGLASVDFDHDGANNFSEFLAGTSPLNGLDVFGVRSIRRQTSGQMELVLAPAFSNRTYHIEGSTDLRIPGWVQLASSAGPTLITQLVVSDLSATNNMMFYRASIDYAW